MPGLGRLAIMEALATGSGRPWGPTTGQVTEEEEKETSPSSVPPEGECTVEEAEAYTPGW